MEKVGIAISQWLKAEKLNQAYLAEKLGVSQPYVNKVLRGSSLGANSAKKWAETFGFSLSFLLTGEGDLFDNNESAVLAAVDADMEKGIDPESAEYWKDRCEELESENTRLRGQVEGLRMALAAVTGEATARAV